MRDKKNIQLFYPHIPKRALMAVGQTLKSRWLGQGPRVAEFEKLWEKKISAPHRAVAVNSCTSALHLSYILAGIGEGDEVIAPVFTYVGANMALLYQKAKIVFADVQKDCLNVDPEDIKKKISQRTKAIVVVHYGGVPCAMDEIEKVASKYQIPIIEDAAWAIGRQYKGKKIGSISDFTCFSFQAVKPIAMGKGGMLTIKNPKLVKRAKRLRSLGIDKTKGLKGRSADIGEIGYRYEMPDIQASLGIGALKELDSTLEHYQELAKTYEGELRGVAGIKYVGGISLAIVLTKEREELKKKLAKYGIESGQLDYRNDRYAIFGGRVKDCPNMDELENKYLVLPMHYHLTKKDIKNICQVIKDARQHEDES